MSNEIPRRIQMEKMVPAELRILEATRLIEEMGADGRLTEAQMLLAKARGLVADVVDGRAKLTVPPGPDEVWHFIDRDGSMLDRKYFNESDARLWSEHTQLTPVRYAKVKP